MNLGIRTNNNNFAEDLIQELIQVKIIPGNEPIKYLNYHNSYGEDSVTTYKTADRNCVPPTASSPGDDYVNTPVTSNSTIYIYVQE